jgi:hypothetical protein
LLQKIYSPAPGPVKVAQLGRYTAFRTSMRISRFFGHAADRTDHDIFVMEVLIALGCADPEDQ